MMEQLTNMEARPGSIQCWKGGQCDDPSNLKFVTVDVGFHFFNTHFVL